MARIKQGDAYHLPVEVTQGGRPLPLENVETVEFTLDGVKSRWPDAVGYDAERGVFLVPLAQEQTFRLPRNTQVKLDLRIKFASGDVIGSDVQYIDVAEAVSREVL